MTGFMAIIGIWVLSLNGNALRRLFKRGTGSAEVVLIRSDETRPQQVDVA